MLREHVTLCRKNKTNTILSLTDTIEGGRLVAVVSAMVNLVASQIIVYAEAIVAFVIRLTANAERLIG